jgi:hypothetical protein
MRKSPELLRLEAEMIKRLTIEISEREAEIANETDSVRRSFMQMAIDEARQELVALEADQ